MKKIAIIRSNYNQEITQELLSGTMLGLQNNAYNLADIDLIEVPGAIEIPLIAKKMAKKNRYSVIIALGAVIRGETSHYDYVCQQVSDGCQSIALEFEIPIIFGVLTTENEEQAWDRLGGKHGHKGIDAATCALAMQSVLHQLDKQ
jgi:6,7-dimethyl-8-ribityllumazine synthase